MTSFPFPVDLLPAVPEVRDPDQFGIAIVGAGDIVKSAHLPAYQEMGYRVARKHADKLRLLCIGVGFVLTLLLLIPALSGSGQIALVCVWLAVIAVMFGIIVERWLFFAEAKHTVGLYYGR